MITKGGIRDNKVSPKKGEYFRGCFGWPRTLRVLGMFRKIPPHFALPPLLHSATFLKKKSHFWKVTFLYELKTD